MSKQKGKKTSAKFMDKIWVKALLVLLSGALMFMGPTYFLYVFRFSIPYLILVLIGLAFFVFGVVLFGNVFLKEKAKS
jgi:hypothetical protein